jgi:hypothetical protein
MHSPPARSVDRLALFSIACVLIAAVYASATGIALIWDGAYQLVYSLVDGSAFYHHTRYHSWLVWQPTLWLSSHTTSFNVLLWTYGAPYLLAPAIGLALSWWVVRNTAPQLFVWAVFGITGSTLPGQIFIINDSIFQQHLFWPVFLGLLVPLTWPKRIVLALLAIFQLSHPIGAVLIGGASVAAALVGFENPGQRQQYFTRAAIAALFAIVCLVKIFAWPDGYARQELEWQTVLARLAALRFWHLCYGLVGLYAAAVFLWSNHTRPAIAALLLTTACWIFWATDVPAWNVSAMNYRRWVVPFAAPFFALAVWSRLRPGTGTMRQYPAAILPLLFVVVLAIQCTQWQRLTTQLTRAMAGAPGTVIAAESLPFIKDTPLEHWSVVTLSLALQGRTPQKIVLDAEALPLQHEGVPLSFFAVKPVENPGWFDWSALQLPQQ